MTPEERTAVHFERYLELGGNVKFSMGGIDFVVSNPYVMPDARGIGVSIRASDTFGLLPTDNPYEFVNPPIAVVTQHAVYDQDGNLVTPRVIDSSNVINAAKQMVYDAVTLRAKQLGWMP